MTPRTGLHFPALWMPYAGLFPLMGALAFIAGMVTLYMDTH